VARQPWLEDREKRRLLKPEMIWEIEGSLRIAVADITEASEARSDWSEVSVSLDSTPGRG
jgi:amidase